MSETNNEPPAVEFFEGTPDWEAIFSHCGEQVTSAAKLERANDFLDNLLDRFIIWRDQQLIDSSSLKQQLAAFDHNVRSLQKVFRAEKFETLQRLLTATSIDMNLNLAVDETAIDAQKLLHDLERQVTDARRLIDRFHQRHDHYARLKFGEQLELRFRGGMTPTDLTNPRLTKKRRRYRKLAFENLVPFMEKRPSRASPETLMVTDIASLFEFLFERPFAVTTKDGKKRSRYGGPSLRFAYAILAELGLLHYFGSTEQQIYNGIGDAWTNQKKLFKPTTR